MFYLIFSAVLTLFAVQPTYTINGQIEDNTGKPAGGVRVCAVAEDFDSPNLNRPIACSKSNPQGAFSIVVDKASTYQIIYDDAANGRWPTYLPFFRPPSGALPEVAVDDGNVSPWVTISMLPKNGLLVGRSVDTKTGLPVESVDFTMCHAGNPQVCWRTSAKSADGRFTLPAPHAPFTLRVKAAGFDDWIGPNGEQKETPITVAPDTKIELSVYLKRTAAAADKSISENEKVKGVNLPAPDQLSPENDSVFDFYPRQTVLKWSPVAGAVSYGVEVDYCEGREKVCVNPQPLRLLNNPSASGITSETYEFRFVGAQPGRWRVWAVDKEGREGFKSPWRTFVYLR